MATRLRFASLALFSFGAFLTLPELYSNAPGLLQNAIGNLMGLAIIVTTAIVAFVEWFPSKRIARPTAPALLVLAFVASVVIARFIIAFLPILTLKRAEQNPGVIMGFVFSLFALVYIVVLCRSRMVANVTSYGGSPCDAMHWRTGGPSSRLHASRSSDPADHYCYPTDAFKQS
jgi:hypothetical protein